MDGDLAPLPELIGLCQNYNTILVVDDSHATGVMGKTGKGTAEYFGVEGQVDVIVTTLGKAMGGGLGGVAAVNTAIAEHLIQSSRYRFSNGPTAANVAYAFAAFQYLEKHPELLTQLHNAAAYFKTEMRRAGFNVPDSAAPIVPVIIGNPGLTMTMSEALFEQGVFVQGYTFPAVPERLERLRFIISAGHDNETLDQVVAACVKTGKKLGVI